MYLETMNQINRDDATKESLGNQSRNTDVKDFETVFIDSGLVFISKNQNKIDFLLTST